MKLLAVDSLSEHPGGVLFENGMIIGEAISDHPRSLFERRSEDELFPLVASLYAADIDGVAVTVGPGSFTGIRVGLALVQGLFLGRAVAAFGVCTLDAIAEAVAPANVVPVVQLRKTDWFVSHAGEIRLVNEKQLIEISGENTIAAVGTMPDAIAALRLPRGLAEATGRLAMKMKAGGLDALHPKYLVETYVK